MEKKLLALSTSLLDPPLNTLDFIDKHDPYTDPLWEKHCLLHIPKTEFAQFSKDNPGKKLNILDIGQQRFNEILDRFSELKFDPRLLFSNSGDLQNWANFHIHAIAGSRLTENGKQWSAIDDFENITYPHRLKIAGSSFRYAEVQGTRSFDDLRQDKVLAIDISYAVITEYGISYDLLVKMIDSLITELQKEPYEMGTTVIIPKGATYKILFLIKKTK